MHAGIVFHTKHTFKDNGFCQNEAEFSCIQICLDLDGLKIWKTAENIVAALLLFLVGLQNFLVHDVSGTDFYI